MRKVISMLVLAATVLVGAAALAPTAQAGDGYWSTGCRSDVYWYGFPGQGSYYWYSSDPPDSAHIYWVGSGFYQKFIEFGAECGSKMGRPVDSAHPHRDGMYIQKFGPGNCVIALPGYYPGYFQADGWSFYRAGGSGCN